MRQKPITAIRTRIRQTTQSGQKKANNQTVDISWCVSQINALTKILNDYISNAGGNYDATGTVNSVPKYNNAIITCTNNSGGGLNYGDVVVWDAGGGSFINTTVTPNDETICGVVVSDSTDKLVDAVANGVAAQVCIAGVVYVNVDADFAAVSIGDYLVTNNAVTEARKATGGQGDAGVFARALEAAGSGVGLILCEIYAPAGREKYWELSGTNLTTTKAGQDVQLTGDLELSKVDPEIRLTDTGNSEYSRETRADTSNAMVKYNRVYQPGGGNAISLDGTNEFGFVADNVNQDIGTGDFSVAGWIKTTSSAATHQAIFGKTSAGLPNGSWAFFGSSPDLYFFFDPITGASETVTYGWTNVNDGNWHSVAATMDRDGNMLLYVDGILRDTESIAASAADNLNTSNGLMIGGRPLAEGGVTPNAGTYYTGAMDEFCIWKGRILTQNEVTDFHNAGAGRYIYNGGTFPTDGSLMGTNLISVYHFDETTGLTATDSISAINITLSNTEDADWVTGVVASTGSNAEAQVLKSEDGAGMLEKGIHTLGDSAGRAVVNGRTIRLQINGVEQGQVNASGQLVLRNSANSTGALQVQNAAGTTILNVDTSNTRVGINTTTPGALLHVQKDTTAVGGGPKLLSVTSTVSSATTGSMEVNNASTNAAAAALYFMFSGSTTGYFGAFCQNHTTIPYVQAACGVLVTGGVGGLVLGTRIASPIKFAINDVIKFGIDTSGNMYGTADSQKTYFGAANDGYIEFDGNSLNIKADAVTGTDKIALQSDTIFEGAGVGFPYGSFYGNDIAWIQASAAQDTWYEITDADTAVGQINLTTFADSELTVTIAGKYLITWSLAQSVSLPNKVLQAGIMVDAAIQNEGRNMQRHPTSNNTENMSGTAILNLAANAVVSLGIRTTSTGTPDLTVQYINMSLTMVGG